MISPYWAGRRLYRLWFTSPKHPEPARETRWREQARSVAIPHEHGPIATYQWGDGADTVLLLHGWSGRGPQLGAFVAPLLKHGLRVVAFDAPGHGRTPGTSSSIFRMNAALQAVVEETGPVQAVIAHSFGAMVLAYALNNTEFTTAKAVCISSPTTPDFLVDRFSAALQVNDTVKHHFRRYTEQQYEPDIWRHIAADHNARTLSVPALIIHDRDDHDVPWQLSQQLADAWPNARLQLTSGLGHRRILRNRQVIDSVVEFVTGENQPIS